MSKLFVSYSRESKVAAEALANDIRTLGHIVWFDQELAGGQAWWNQILENIRNCDVFVFVLTPQSLNSVACMREYAYAAALSRLILPILVVDGVSINLLPPALSQIQFVDYRDQNRSSALRLARALAPVPPVGPVPDPLPAPPEVPISYLGGIATQIETLSTLSYQQQSALVVDLKRGLRDPETRSDAEILLDRLRRRHDLLAAIAEEIDELLKGVTKVSPAAPAAGMRAQSAQDLDQKPQYASDGRTRERLELQRTGAKFDASRSPTPTRRERIACALCGAALGAAVGWWSLLTTAGTIRMPGLLVGTLTGAGLAAAGAISGRRMQVIVPAIVGAGLAFLGVLAVWPKRDEALSAAVILGAPAGAILGAIAGLIFIRLRLRAKPGSGSGAD